MKKENIYDKIFEKKCEVCGHSYMADIYEQGKCSYCGWKNSHLISEHPNDVIFPNLISLNKAKKLYEEGKEFRPELIDFLDGFNMYGEMEFWYKNINCWLDRANNEGGIKFGWSPENIYYFSDKKDFIANAKIGNEYVRDIWDKVENPKYM